MAYLKRKNITVARHKFILEIYPTRKGCNGPEGPFFEIFAHDYKGCLYAFSNKHQINKLVKKKFVE
mgnify:CR=1 FL=1|jgi:hypothetical protein